MMLDILNQAIKEYSQQKIQMDPETRGATSALSAKTKLDKGQALSPIERKTVAKLLPREAEVKEGVEEQSELILAAKDMMDKVTAFLEDLATMKTESMLELADRIRDEMGAEKSDAFLQKVKPAIEQAETTLGQTRTELDNGVRVLTGEEVATDTIGADDTMNTCLLYTSPSPRDS